MAVVKMQSCHDRSHFARCIVFIQTWKRDIAVSPRKVLLRTQTKYTVFVSFLSNLLGVSLITVSFLSLIGGFFGRVAIDEDPNLDRNCKAETSSRESCSNGLGFDDYSAIIQKQNASTVGTWVAQW